MSSIPFYLTPAGRALLVKPDNTGTNELRIGQVGISSSSAGIVSGKLSGEFKRLTTFAGDVVADDTIHVTIRDDSADVYSLRAFALYTETGALLGSYAQTAIIMEKSAQAMMLLSTDIQFLDLNVTGVTFGASNWINPTATTEMPGVVELADELESIGGTEGRRAMTPGGTKAALDARLGVGAPSSFVKSLLTAANAALLRLAIGLGNAATRNEGHGNGLDADLLDGKHGTHYLDWPNLSNVPLVFAPAAHTHPWNQLTSIPSTATRWPSFAEVTDKPSEYRPASHVHSAEDINSGVLVSDRIPTLPISKIQALQNVIDSKANLSGAAFTGNVSTAGSLSFGAGSALLYAEGGTSALLRVLDGSGDYKYFRANGVNGNFEVLTGTVTVLGKPVWHTGNFKPEDKANLSGASFTNSVSVAGSLTVKGWNNVETDGVIYFGSGNSFIYKVGKNFAFNNPQGNWNAELRSGGQIWTADSFNPATKADLTGATFNGTVGLRGNIGLDYISSRSRIRFADDAVLGGICIDALTTDGSGFAPLLLRGSDIRFFGNAVWHGGNFNPGTKANLSGATFTGMVVSNNGFRSNGWGTTPTDGVIYFGVNDSYIYKAGTRFTFRNIEGGFTANLKDGGDIWTTSSFDPNTKANSSHRHAIADVDGLQSALDGKQASGNYAASVHSHAISQVVGLQGALDGKQPAGEYAAATHTHAIAQVSGLQGALDGKQPVGSYAPAAHTHTVANVTGLQAALDACVKASEHTKLTAKDGWRKGPDGIIEQWGYVSAPATSEGEAPQIVFPIAFPNACHNVQLTPLIPSPSKFYDLAPQCIGEPTKTGQRVYFQAPSDENPNGFAFYWRAIGS